MDYRATFFPDLVAAAYLSHASIAPLNIRCRTAMLEVIHLYGTSGLKAWGSANERRIQLRQKLGTLIGASNHDIALTQNTSHSIYLVAFEYPWQAGDSLVLFRNEFPANVIPWKRAAEHYQLKVIWLEVEDLIQRSPAFEAAMAQKPRLLAISWVQYQTGVMVPLEELSAIRASYQVDICLDAIQGLGPLTMDLHKTPLDFVACGGHKWLLSPEGTAFLYVAPAKMAEMRPNAVSWVSQQDASSFLFRGKGFVNYEAPLKTGPLRYEMATMNAVGLAGMEASIDLILEVSAQRVSERALGLAEYARAQLRNNGVPVPGTTAGNVCLAMDAERLMACQRACDAEGVILTSPDGHLRISAHFYNTEQEIDHAVRIIKGFF